MTTCSRAITAVLLLLALPAAAYRVTDITVAPSGNMTQVTITSDGDISYERFLLTDPETGDLIALASDTQQSTYRGRMEWTTGPSNRGDARDMLRKWAQALNARLQEATGKGSFGSEP